MNGDLRTTVTAATALYGKIARAYDNLKKLGIAKVTVGAVDARLLHLEKSWEKYDSLNDEMLDRLSLLTDDPYFKEDIPSLAEEAYLLNKGLMLDLKRELQAAERTTAAASTGSSTSAPRTTLPRIQLPIFSGKYEDWPAFRDLFQSLIGQDRATKQVEKLHYLKSSVKGEAELLIRNLSTTEDNYERAWSTLSSYYENKRLLVRAYLGGFLALPKMKNESAADLRRIFHGIKNAASSLDSIQRPISSSEDLYVYLSVELLDNRSRREWETAISGSSEPPTYADLEQFLEKRLHTLESMPPARSDGASSRAGGGAASPKTTRSHHIQKKESKEGGRGRCAHCQGDHFIMFCGEYKKKSAGERKQYVQENSLCANCLGRHKTAECTSKKNCSACGGRHHTSLHDNYRESTAVQTSHVAQRPLAAPVTVLLATARVQVADRHGSWHAVRALVDQGSESSIVSERLAQRLRLPRSSASITVFGVGGVRTGVSKGRVELTVQSRSGGPPFVIGALVLPKLTIFAGGCSEPVQPWAHLQELADPDFGSSDPMDLLLGADVYATILCQGLRKGGPREPVAQKTSLGWIISGAAGDSIAAPYQATHQCRVEEDLAGLVRRFWEQEEPQRPTARMSQEDLACEEHFRRHHSRTSDGRYVVRLPTIEPLPDLSGTRLAANRALQHTTKRFKRDDDFRQLYSDFMRSYLTLGHMHPAPRSHAEATSRACYLPHHGVFREGSATTKLRVVFNGSSYLPTGDSLNKFLRTGPNLLPPLADILSRWRQHRYVFATDVEKMYRQILVHQNDRCLQRILWKENDNEDTREWWLSTVTYGLSCAPYLAIRTLHQLATDEDHRYPLGAAVLRSDVYMDDVLTGAGTLSEAQETLQQLVLICQAGGFPLKKWSANNSTLLEKLPAEDCLQHEAKWWLPGENHATLGLRWHPCEDLFSFSTQHISLSTFTKRSVLSLTAKLFDPLGWLSPTTVLAKINIQSTWLLGVGWDTPLPDDHVKRWQRFQDELPWLERLHIPRWLGGDGEGSLLQLHGFADASVRAYAAVLYLKTEKDDKTVIRLLAARTKVAPLKQVSLPRLELSAATLLVRLAAQALSLIGVKRVPLHLWSDSTVALSWIRGHPATWTTFVANRVSEIQTALPDAQWHHIPGRENPADCASRGLYPGEMVDHPLWWQGPPWLISDSGPWPVFGENMEKADLPERRTRVHISAVARTEESPLLLRHSSLHRLLRVTSWCRRWLWRPRRQPPAAIAGVLSTSELEDARLLWIRIVQSERYKEELSALRQGRTLPTSSTVLKLNPTLDATGLLRVGGRLRHAKLAFDAAHPIILPGDSHLTHLVVDAHHRRTLHGGVQMTLCSLRQEFWIPRGRSLVKTHIHRCVTCVRWRAAVNQPLMGDLPAPRVTPSRPFLNTGVDYAGPVWLRTSKGRGHKASKAFIVVFVCLSSRAVHLDVVSDYSSVAFIAALHRFIARRGVCRALFSDCGTTFVGADTKLRELFSAASSEGRCIAAYAAQERIQWRFNPPAAPNFGGIWEAAVKSMKVHLRRVIGEATLTFEEMTTLLTQIEACLNSRPLQPLSDDPEDLSALTPGHFLIGTALTAVPEPSLLDEPPARLSRWQQLQHMKDHFWHRWTREYLHSLAHRPKWFKASQEARVGRLCLLRSEMTPPTKWPLARITHLHPGSDGHVRVVDLRTATSTLTRPVSKIVFLPCGDDTALANS